MAPDFQSGITWVGIPLSALNIYYIKIYYERTEHKYNIKSIFSHILNSVNNNEIEKWCRNWNVFTKEFITINMYLYSINPYIGIKI